MRVLKEGQFLKFLLEDDSIVTYDLAKRQTIGKRGMPVVSLRSQLSGKSISSIIGSFDNKNYANFLNFVERNCCRKISNFGSLLEIAKEKKFSKYEQYFSAGINDVMYGFDVQITEVPKGLIKICREKEIPLTQELFCAYSSFPDFFTIAFSTDFASLSNKELAAVLTKTVGWRYNNDYGWLVKKLTSEYLYDITALLRYLDNLKSYEAIEDVHSLLQEIFDYARMMKHLSPKFEKYPKNFLTTHKIACRNYNRLKEKFEEEDYKKRIDKSLEWSLGEYCFIYPESTQDIKDEAVQQSNCVASYIQSVLDGKCHILFLRKKDDKNKSLVTIEVRDGQIVQAKGKFNRDTFDDEKEIIEKYNQRLRKMVA